MRKKEAFAKAKKFAKEFGELCEKYLPQDGMVETSHLTEDGSWFFVGVNDDCDAMEFHCYVEKFPCKTVLMSFPYGKRNNVKKG